MRIGSKKYILGIITGILAVSIITVQAIELCNAHDIEFAAKDSKWNVDTVEEALNDLYSGTCDEQAAEPVIKEGLVPITLDDDGTVHYADTKSKWYNYCEKKWANAVILVESPTKQYKVGDTIKESDIESYFVWIPKYKYKLWNTGRASKSTHEIEIKFTTDNTSDVEGISCKTPMTSGNIGNCNNGEWMTHPAFISLGVNGFWVGKYEIGYKGATSVAEAEAHVNSNDSTKIIVKPNVYSWRANDIKSFFEASYNYKRELDSHMMKNTEWGAVAYLSHSKYGINKKININNSINKTGYSATANTYQNIFPGESGDGDEFNQPYNTSIGYLASTTGNITGIYDMSGGTHEYMASYKSESYTYSGFTTSPIETYNSKYFDVYNAASEINAYQYGILGDATLELGSFKEDKDGDEKLRWHGNWYGGVSQFVDNLYSWHTRGSEYFTGILANQMSFYAYTGQAINTIGSRLVLSP